MEELVGELSPKPDVPATMRKLIENKGLIASESPKSVFFLTSRVTTLNSEPEQSNALPAPAPARPAVVKPIAPARYKIELTASAELRDKLERLRALMRSSVPDGDLATIIEEAVIEKIERLESKRFGKTKAPRKSVEEAGTSPSSRYIPASVKRTVCERDYGKELIERCRRSPNRVSEPAAVYTFSHQYGAALLE